MSQLVRTLGHSRQNRPIDGWFFNLARENPQLDTLFFGAFHGDEPESAQVLSLMLKAIEQTPALLEDRAIGIVPVVNPDGLFLKTRKNAWQVDINRNFSASNWTLSSQQEHYHGGYSPDSEPETQIVHRLLDRYHPTKIISLHTPYEVINYDGPPCAEELAQLMGRHNGYRVDSDIGYGTPGSFGTWAGVERGIPVITLELAEGVPAAQQWERHRGALLAAIQYQC